MALTQAVVTITTANTQQTVHTASGDEAVSVSLQGGSPPVGLAHYRSGVLLATTSISVHESAEFAMQNGDTIEAIAPVGSTDVYVTVGA